MNTRAKEIQQVNPGGPDKKLFLKYGHVAYQNKGNKAYNSMLANIFPLHTPLTPGVGSNVFFSFLKVFMLRIKLTGMKQRKQCKHICCPFTCPRPLDGG